MDEHTFRVLVVVMLAAKKGTPLIGFDNILLIAGVAIPFVTAVLAKRHAPDFVKGLLSVAVAGVVTFFRTNSLDGPLTWQLFVHGFAVAEGTALVSWLGLTSDWTDKLNQLTGSFGVGKSSTTAG